MLCIVKTEKREFLRVALIIADHISHFEKDTFTKVHMYSLKC